MFVISGAGRLVMELRRIAAAMAPPRRLLAEQALGGKDTASGLWKTCEIRFGGSDSLRALPTDPLFTASASLLLIRIVVLS